MRRRLLDALPSVPKVVAEMIDEYARRQPPSDLIRELSRAITAASDSDQFPFGMRLHIPAFYSGAQLQQTLMYYIGHRSDEGCLDAMSLDVLSARMGGGKNFEAQNAAEIIKHFAADDPGALCAWSLPKSQWVKCLLLAVPDGFSADSWPLTASGGIAVSPLFSANDPVCGLLIYEQTPFI